MTLVKLNCTTNGHRLAAALHQFEMQCIFNEFECNLRRNACALIY